LSNLNQLRFDYIREEAEVYKEAIGALFMKTFLDTGVGLDRVPNSLLEFQDEMMEKYPKLSIRSWSNETLLKLLQSKYSVTPSRQKAIETELLRRMSSK